MLLRITSSAYERRYNIECDVYPRPRRGKRTPFIPLKNFEKRSNDLMIMNLITMMAVASQMCHSTSEVEKMSIKRIPGLSASPNNLSTYNILTSQSSGLGWKRAELVKPFSPTITSAFVQYFLFLGAVTQWPIDLLNLIFNPWREKAPRIS